MDLETKNKLLIEINEKPEDIITAVQNDTNSRYLDVYLYDNGTPIDLTDCEVRICAIKPSDTGEVWNNGEITEATNGRCQFLLTTDMLATVGVMETQIQIWQNNTNILSTEIFNIYVTRSLLGETSVESSNEYGALVVLFQNLYEALYLMEHMVNNFGTAGTVAEARNILTFWEGIEYIAKYVDTTLAGKIDEVIAQATVQAVLDLIGTAADTGATETEGTVFGKLNALFKHSEELSGLGNAKFISVVRDNSAALSLASITGKGRILYANIETHLDETKQNSSVVFSKDGTDFKTIQETGDYAYFNVAIHNPNFVQLTYNSGIDYYYPIGGSARAFSGSNNSVFPEFVESNNTHSSYVTSGIKFDSSFEIRIESDTTFYVDAVIAYILE